MKSDITPNVVFIYFRYYFLILHIGLFVLSSTIKTLVEFDKSILVILNLIIFMVLSFFLINTSKLDYLKTYFGKLLLLLFGLPAPIAASILLFENDLLLIGFIYLFLMLPIAIHYNVLKQSLYKQDSSKNL